MLVFVELSVDSVWCVVQSKRLRSSFHHYLSSAGAVLTGGEEDDDDDDDWLLDTDSYDSLKLLRNIQVCCLENLVDMWRRGRGEGVFQGNQEVLRNKYLLYSEVPLLHLDPCVFVCLYLCFSWVVFFPLKVFYSSCKCVTSCDRQCAYACACNLHTKKEGKCLKVENSSSAQH